MQLHGPFVLLWSPTPSHLHCCSKEIHAVFRNAGPNTHAGFDSLEEAAGLGEGRSQHQ